MFDLGDIVGAIGALKQLSDTVRSLKGLAGDDKAAVLAPLIDANQRLLAAQAQQFAMQAKIRELEAELEERAEWKANAARYEMVSFPGRGVVYAQRQAIDDPEPPHYACPNCFKQRHVSIMQPTSSVYGGKYLHCPKCKMQVGAPDAD